MKKFSELRDLFFSTLTIKKLDIFVSIHFFHLNSINFVVVSIQSRHGTSSLLVWFSNERFGSDFKVSLGVFSFKRRLHLYWLTINFSVQVCHVRCDASQLKSWPTGVSPDASVFIFWCIRQMNANNRERKKVDHDSSFFFFSFRSFWLTPFQAEDLMHNLIWWSKISERRQIKQWFAYHWARL